MLKKDKDLTPEPTWTETTLEDSVEVIWIQISSSEASSAEAVVASAEEMVIMLMFFSC